MLVEKDGIQVRKKVSHTTMVSQPDGEHLGFCVSYEGTGMFPFCFKTVQLFLILNLLTLFELFRFQNTTMIYRT